MSGSGGSIFGIYILTGTITRYVQQTTGNKINREISNAEQSHKVQSTEIRARAWVDMKDSDSESEAIYHVVDTVIKRDPLETKNHGKDEAVTPSSLQQVINQKYLPVSSDISKS